MLRIIVAIITLYTPVHADEAKIAFNNHCRTCHVLSEGDNRLGPSLYNLFGRQAGTVREYPYSSAFEDAGFIWDRDYMDVFLANPDQIVPGNNMNPFQGLTDPVVRALIIEAMGG